MSEGPQCLGICLFDWDAGVCLGCGRTAEQIDGTAPEPSAAAADRTDEANKTDQADGAAGANSGDNPGENEAGPRGASQ